MGEAILKDQLIDDLTTADALPSGKNSLVTIKPFEYHQFTTPTTIHFVFTKPFAPAVEGYLLSVRSTPADSVE